MSEEKNRKKKLSDRDSFFLKLVFSVISLFVVVSIIYCLVTEFYSEANKPYIRILLCFFIDFFFSSLAGGFIGGMAANCGIVGFRKLRRVNNGIRKESDASRFEKWRYRIVWIGEKAIIGTVIFILIFASVCLSVEAKISITGVLPK